MSKYFATPYLSKLTVPEMTYNVFKPYSLTLSKLTAHYLLSQSLRSSNTNLLVRPSGIANNFSPPVFSVATQSTWNSLLQHICSINEGSPFKRPMKSHLFLPASAI